MRLLGITLLAATLLLGMLKFDHLSIWSAGVGIALGAGLFLALITNKPEEAPVPPEQQNNPWQVRFLDLQAQTNLTIACSSRRAVYLISETCGCPSS